LEWYGRFLLENRKNRTKGENRLAIGTKQVQDRVSLPEMVQIFKSPSPAFQAFHHAKVERLRFTRRNRRENEHR
jgi:hypothetical protein